MISPYVTILCDSCDFSYLPRYGYGYLQLSFIYPNPILPHPLTPASDMCRAASSRDQRPSCFMVVVVFFMARVFLSSMLAGCSNTLLPWEVGSLWWETTCKSGAKSTMPPKDPVLLNRKPRLTRSRAPLASSGLLLTPHARDITVNKEAI